MSEFLSKLKSVFVVTDETAAASGNNSQNTAAATPTPSATAAAAPAIQTSGGGAVNEKFAEILFKAIEANNQDGFDYFEFKQALRNLSRMAMDEGTKYQSAYAMAQAMGANDQKLLASAKYYLQILTGEQSKFNEAHAQQRSKLIGNREEDIKSHENQIQQKTQQIQDLTRQIEEHRKNSEFIRNEIQQSMVKIETTKADFDATYQAVAGQVQEDILKIQQYIK